MTQLQIWAFIAQSCLNFIFIYLIQGSGQQKTVTDMKTDLRTTKEDLMAQIKDSSKEVIEMIEKQKEQ